MGDYRVNGKILTDGIKVYPNVMVYNENFYAKGEYIITNYERGDVNMDGGIDVADVTALVDIILGT